MKQIVQMTQLRDLRKMKVDQLLRTAQRAADHLSACRVQLDQRNATLNALHAECRVPFETRLLAVQHIEDAYGRLVAVNTKIIGLRTQAAEARTKRDEAARAVTGAEAALATVNRDILRAQGRLTGAEEIRDQVIRKEDVLVQARADDEALDQFSARAGRMTP